MADGNNIRCADIEKLVQFETDSQEAIKEFERIKNKFKEINDTLLSSWKGTGADQYKKKRIIFLKRSEMCLRYLTLSTTAL